MEQKYVRIQGRERSYITNQPKGIFSMCWRLIMDHVVTDEEKAEFESIDKWFKENLIEPEPCKNGEKVITYFKVATTGHMLDKLQPAIRMLDKYHHEYDIIYTNYIGKIIYEDEYQVAVSIDSFDQSKPLLGPETFCQKGSIAEKCIITFSCKVRDDILNRYQCKKEVCSGTANGDVQVYSLMQKGEKILFYMSPIGAACAGCVMDEVSYMTGAKKFIVFGSCGSLNNEVTNKKLIIPTESYRDEGFSYHYYAPSDYIKITNAEVLEKKLDLLAVPYVKGRSWTTDAIYRETEDKVAKRKMEGCIAVEMESAGLQALCSYKGLDLYTFFFSSDLLDGVTWENVNLGTEEEHKSQISCFDTALKLAEMI